MTLCYDRYQFCNAGCCRLLDVTSFSKMTKLITLGTSLVNRICILPESNAVISPFRVVRKHRGPLTYHRTAAHYRAAFLSEAAKPLVIGNIAPIAKLKDREVRVEVHTCAVHIGEMMLWGLLEPGKLKVPFVPGFEMCGVVKEVGAKVKAVRPGNRVIGLKSDGAAGWAEECVILEQDAWSVPTSIHFETGASLLNCYMAPLLGLNRKAGIEADDTVLVTGASDVGGLAAVDLAANIYKAKVIGVCETDDNARLVRNKGAFASLKCEAGDLHSRVMEATSGEGAHIIYETVGGKIFDEALKCTAHQCTVLAADYSSFEIPSVSIFTLVQRCITLIGFSLKQYRDADDEFYRQLGNDVIEMCAKGQISPRAPIVFPLEQVNDAIECVRQVKSAERVILKIR